VGAHSTRLELPGLDFEQEGSGASEVFFEAIGGEAAAEDLPADSGVASVIKVVCDIERVVGIRQCVNGGVARGNDNGLVDCELASRRFLFDEACLGQRPKVFAAAAIRRGQLRSIDFDNEIIYFEGADGCKTMFDGLDADRAFFQGGAARSFGDIGGNGPDTDRLRYIPYRPGQV
jgi:hypothetical protein